MKKRLTLAIAICLALLCGCGGEGFGNTKDPILGKWECDSHLAYFLENGEVYDVSCGSSTGVYGYQLQDVSSYSVDGNTISFVFEGEEGEAPFKIADDRMFIYENEWLRCEVEPVQSDIEGTWQLVGIDGDFDTFKYGVTVNEYIRTFYFYSDNTYKADWWFYHKGGEWFGEVTHGNYQFVNDGQTICFDNRGYYEYELLGYGLLELVDPSGNTLLYILQ